VYNDKNDDPAINIGKRSMDFWIFAATRPLSVAPDDSECKWLKEWEAEQRKEQEAHDKEMKAKSHGTPLKEKKSVRFSEEDGAE
jgi:hypothetical protein